MPTNLPSWIERIGALLEPDERQSVLGDIQERGATFRALLDLTGVVLLRQLQAWKSWHPWALGASLFLPAVVTAYMTVSLALGIREDLLRYQPNYAWTVLGILILTWTSGYTLAAITRRPLPLLLPVMAAVVWLTQGSRLWGGYGRTRGFTLASTLLLFVALPSIHGFVRGCTRRPLPGSLAAIAAVLGAATVWNTFPNATTPPVWLRWLLGATMMWPALYVLTMGVRHPSAGAPYGR